MKEDYSFSGQRPNEAVENMVKNHPFVLFVPGLKAVLFLAIPFGFLIFNGASTLFSISLFVCFLIAFAIFSKAYYEYSASVLILTNERIIYLDQVGFFYRKIIETNLDKVQDVASDTGGMIRTMLDFGDLKIRTAGSSVGGEIVIKNIASPYEIQQEVTKRL